MQRPHWAKVILICGVGGLTSLIIGGCSGPGNKQPNPSMGTNLEVPSPDSASSTAVDDPAAIAKPQTPEPLALDSYVAVPNLYINQNVVNVYGEPALDTELVTQALHGEPLTVIDQQGPWLQVELPHQSNYSGWLQVKEVSLVPPDQTYPYAYVVKEFEAPVFARPETPNKITTRLTMGNIVYGDADQTDPSLVKVKLIDGEPGYVLREQLRQFNPSGLSSPVTGGELMATAKKLLNQPYLWGGMTSDGVDCSGFVHTVFKVHGIKLHRDVDLQFDHDGVFIEPSELRTGDLVFFETYKSGPSHIGIYVDNGQFINASSSQGVSYASLDSDYYRDRFLGAKRIF